MNNQEKRAAFFESLKSKLDNISVWPHRYMYKFIVPGEDEKIQQVRALFSDVEKFSTRQSSKGNFISATAIVWVDNSDEIINTYKSAAEIEGIISL
jgi:putative lipoic acid-binding regulatory protein